MEIEVLGELRVHFGELALEERYKEPSLIVLSGTYQLRYLDAEVKEYTGIVQDFWTARRVWTLWLKEHKYFYNKRVYDVVKVKAVIIDHRYYVVEFLN